MKRISIGIASFLITVAATGCTTTGFGTGQSMTGNIGARFSWVENGGTHGTMIASLSNGEVFEGVFFQITSESVADYDPLWLGWGPGWGWGWDGWGPWGPSIQTITNYSGQVLANLQGPNGYMRCDFRLMSPSSGMAGGGLGQCQLPSGTIIDAQFVPHSGY